MPNLTVANFDAFMKETYPDFRVTSLAIKKRPLLSWMPKYDEFYGDAYVVPVLYEDPQGRSAVLSTAITNVETTKQVKFVASSRKADYAVVKLEREAIMAASKDVGAFLRAKDTQIQGKIRQIGKSLHLALYRNGSGSIGKIATSGISGAVVTLTEGAEVHNFGEGQVIVANNTDDAVSVKASAIVASTDVGAKTITFTGNVPGTWADADFLFTEGDPDKKVVGLGGWLPLAAPSSTAFFGVDRTKHVTRLGGQRVDNSNRSILENANELAMKIGEEEGEPDALFMNPRAGLLLQEQVGAQVVRDDGKSKANMGFGGFTIYNFLTGPLDVIFDIGCPPTLAYMLQKNTWRVAHMGPLPHMINPEGLIGATTDTWEYRCGYFAECFCIAPGKNGVMSVAST